METGKADLFKVGENEYCGMYLIVNNSLFRLIEVIPNSVAHHFFVRWAVIHSENGVRLGRGWRSG